MIWIKRFAKWISKEVFYLAIWIVSVALAGVLAGHIANYTSRCTTGICIYVCIAKSIGRIVLMVCSGVSHIIIECVWPLLIVFAFVVLDRRGKLDDFLDAILGFIGRSKYGAGDVMPATREEGEDDSVRSGKNSPPRSTASQETEPSGPCSSGSRSRVFESHVFKVLQDETQRYIQRDVRVFNSNIIFDGALQRGNNITAIEVKYYLNIDRLKRYLMQVDHFYQTLSDKERKRFSLLVCTQRQCVNDSFKEKLQAIKRNLLLPVEFRSFE